MYLEILLCHQAQFWLFQLFSQWPNEVDNWANDVCNTPCQSHNRCSINAISIAFNWNTPGYQRMMKHKAGNKSSPMLNTNSYRGHNKSGPMHLFLELTKSLQFPITNLEFSQHARALWGRPWDHFWLLFHLLKTGYPSLLYSWWFLRDLRVITKHFLREPKMKEELYSCPWEKRRIILVPISTLWLFPESSRPSTK